MASSVVVVEIDTRKGPLKSVFESAVENQTEQAKQFWKTLSLAPHIESSLYSKEISQQIKPNSLKPITIDNARKPMQTDKKTDAFLKNVQVLQQVDDIMKLQQRLSKIENIRKLHKTKREKSLETFGQTRAPLTKSESASNWNSGGISSRSQEFNENEYEVDPDELNDVDVVKNLEFDEQ